MIISPGGKKIFMPMFIYRCACVDVLAYQIAVELVYNPRFVPVIVR